MSVEEKSPRRQEEEAVSFIEEDDKHVRYPHTDPTTRNSIINSIEF